MTQVVTQVKLIPEADQAAALSATLRTLNDLATWVSEVAFVNDVPREYELRKHQGRVKLTVGHIKLSVSPLQAPLPSRAARQEAAGTGCERRRSAARCACPVGDFQGIAWSGRWPDQGCRGPRPPNRSWAVSAR
ncbi:hypothetical protein ACWCQS_06465 [Streptomyces sp. NPDC002076]